MGGEEGGGGVIDELRKGRKQNSSAGSRRDQPRIPLGTLSRYICRKRRQYVCVPKLLLVLYIGFRDLYPCPQGERAAEWVLLERDTQMTDMNKKDGLAYALCEPRYNQGGYELRIASYPLHRRPGHMLPLEAMESSSPLGSGMGENEVSTAAVAASFREGSYPRPRPAHCCCKWSQF